jgi:hypothetical protein
MYEILLKWGLDTLGKLGSGEHKAELAIVLEAVKTKNALVSKRFDIAANAAEELLNLTLELEDELHATSQDRSHPSHEKKGNDYINSLEQAIHSKYYRRLMRIRSRFEMTNDLLSSCSIQATEFLNIKHVKSLIRKSNATSNAQIRMLYRKIWTLAASSMLSLIRVTSTDLRFWLSDIPHGPKSDEWAKRDFQLAKDYFLQSAGRKEFYLEIERDGGTDKFWNDNA